MVNCEHESFENCNCFVGFPKPSKKKKPKRKTVKSAKGQFCIYPGCNNPESTNHHYKGIRRYEFMIDGKVPDWMTSHLCVEHHAEIHQNKLDKIGQSELNFYLIVKTLFRLWKQGKLIILD